MNEQPDTAQMAMAQRAAAVMTARDALTQEGVVGGGPNVADIITLAEWIVGTSHPQIDLYGHANG